MIVMKKDMLISFVFMLSVIFGGIPIAGLSPEFNAYVEARYKTYTAEDRELLAEVMYHENYCNGDYIMKLTGSVVLNRVKCEWYPNSIKDVLYQKGQYATVGKFYTEPIPRKVYRHADHLLLFGSIAPDYVLFQSMYPNLGTVWYSENGEYFSY